MLDDALTAKIKSAKLRLLVGGMLQEVEWLRRTGPRDERGRQAVSSTMINALIEQRPQLDRSTIDTDRNDDTVLIVLDAVAITDSDLFRWGDPPHTYSVKMVDGIVQDEETGVRFVSEVTVIR